VWLESRAVNSTSDQPDSEAPRSLPGGDEIPDLDALEADPPASPAPPTSSPAPAGQPVSAVGDITDERPPPLPLPRVIAIANQKGGVGKTTSTINIGACLAELGHRTLIVDLDPQANASTGLGIDPRSLDHGMYDVILRDMPMEDCIEPTAVKNLFLAPSSLDLAGAEIELVPQFSREHRLRAAIDSVVADFDFVLIDCPPSLGLLTVNALTAAKEVLVPIQCEYYALEGLGQLLKNVSLVKANLNPALEISPITVFDSSSRGAKAYRAVTKELVGG